MRIYEFAKQRGVSNKEILSVLKQHGFVVENHMSVISSEALSVLQTVFQPSQSKVIEKNDTPINHEDIDSMHEKEASQLIEKLETHLPEVEEDSYQLRAKKLDANVLFAKIKKTENKPPLKIVHRPLRKRGGGMEAPVVPVVITEIIVDKEKPLFMVAEELGKPSSDLILVLLKQGTVCSRNHVLTTDLIKLLARHFGIAIVEPVRKVQETSLDVSTAAKEHTQGVVRWPVVVVMGHVDHGKTTLLDFIRKTNVASREKGGITQHLGAYDVTLEQGKIVFLDTPGHAAFTNMRRRGARVTDIAVLVVAADDGVMPQTVEALKSIQEARIPIIVAINKIDKAKDKVSFDTIKRQLAQYGLTPEEWGGETIYIPLSAKTGEGVKDLLEMIILQSQLMELKAYPDLPAQGVVLESSVDKGYGFVANLIFLKGTVKLGDYFICGNTTGKVRLLINSVGEKLVQVGSSVPVRIVGFDEIAGAGDSFRVVSYAEYAVAKSSSSFVSNQQQSSATSLDTKKRVINLILKADTYGSVEVARDSIQLLADRNKESLVSYNIVHSGIGEISESDVVLALDLKATLIALHVKIERNAIAFSKKNSVKIIKHDIIYRLVEDLEKTLKDNIFVATVTKKIGDAVVLKVFNIKGAGIIAGAMVKNGVFTKNSKVACIRNGSRCGEGKITSLQRNKSAVKEVHAGFDFAFISDSFHDWQVDDVVECFVVVPSPK